MRKADRNGQRGGNNIIDSLWKDAGSYIYADSAANEAVTDSGNVSIGTTAPNYKLHVVGDIAYTGNIYDVSDLRLKENLKHIENAVEKVSSLNGIYFNYKGEPAEKREVGVIAQEVEKVLPEVVAPDAEGYKSVDYSKLTPLLIEAIKAQQAQFIEAIKTQQAQFRPSRPKLKG